jgi:rhodanese-related sulfurtransferase
MIKNTVSLTLVAALALFALAACDTAKTTADAPEAQVITVDELAAKGSAVTPCDSNGEETRNEHGTIPGAVLLSSYAEYEISELPADKSKTLAFFCSSEKCSAAPKAAQKAIAAGYTDVRWLKVGIKGWKGAGQKTQPVPKT